jgi:hypothetical protein
MHHASTQVSAYQRILKVVRNDQVSAEENAVQMRMDIENFKEPEDQNLQIERFRKAGLLL